MTHLSGYSHYTRSKVPVKFRTEGGDCHLASFLCAGIWLFRFVSSTCIPRYAEHRQNILYEGLCPRLRLQVPSLV